MSPLSTIEHDTGALLPICKWDTLILLFLGNLGLTRNNIMVIFGLVLHSKFGNPCGHDVKNRVHCSKPSNILGIHDHAVCRLIIVGSYDAIPGSQRLTSIQPAMMFHATSHPSNL